MIIIDSLSIRVRMFRGEYVNHFITYGLMSNSELFQYVMASKASMDSMWFSLSMGINISFYMHRFNAGITVDTTILK
jgi:hypothetical protein